MCGIWGLLGSFNNLKESEKYEIFNKIKNRGPDKSIYFDIADIKLNDKTIPVKLGFHRLSIMDTTFNGDQPFFLELNKRKLVLLCNGEIYNFKKIKEKYNFNFKSNSDCEVILHLYAQGGIDLVLSELIGEFAFVILDAEENKPVKLYLSRDQLGVRPLFYCYSKSNFGFCSTMSGLINEKIQINDNITPLKPGSFCKVTIDKKLNFTIENKEYYDFNFPVNLNNNNLELIKKNVRNLFTKVVEERMISDRPLGALLSGGLDSSLVCSIAARYLKKKNKKLYTFSIGIPGSTDKEYAKMVSNHIGSIHKHIEFTNEDFLNALKSTIKCTETYDITTVRASTGQYLVSKWISENTDIKVLLIGDGSDELCSGYMYFHNAPTPFDSHLENIKLLKEIYLYDVLRADRGIASNGLEARVPFLDYRFVDYYMSIDPKLRVPTEGIEKWLLRESFNVDDYLPFEILFRKKEAFSDGVSGEDESWFSIIQKKMNNEIKDNVYDELLKKYTHCKPTSKEALYYRLVFEEYFGDKQVQNVIPQYWLPNWCGDIKEPSARVLDVYNKDKVVEE
jgi:asparagine synthase (glutamine-hydrolysing)